MDAIQTNNTVQTNKKAKNLCVISIITYVVRIFVVGGLVLALSLLETASANEYGLPLNLATNFLSGIFLPIDLVFVLAAYILMIVCRCKFKDYRPAKTLMWVYIGLFVLKLVAAIVLIILFYWWCKVSLSQCTGVFLF